MPPSRLIARPPSCAGQAYAGVVLQTQTFENLYASSGPVIRLPNIQASTDQLVRRCDSPKNALRSGFFSCATADTIMRLAANADIRTAGPVVLHFVADST